MACPATREAVLERGECPLCDQPASAHTSEQPDRPPPDPLVVACRAKFEDAGCIDGQQRKDWQDDGTFDGQTIVCDCCYIAIMPLTRSGQANTDEVPLAITRLRDTLAFLAGQESISAIEALAADAEGQAATAGADTSLHRSASYLGQLARREAARRKGEPIKPLLALAGSTARVPAPVRNLMDVPPGGDAA